ncbi:hypothetical protein [Sorangium sp. So ce542]
MQHSKPILLDFGDAVAAGPAPEVLGVPALPMQGSDRAERPCR